MIPKGVVITSTPPTTASATASPTSAVAIPTGRVRRRLTSLRIIRFIVTPVLWWLIWGLSQYR